MRSAGCRGHLGGTREAGDEARNRFVGWAALKRGRDGDAVCVEGGWLVADGRPWTRTCGSTPTLADAARPS